MLTLNEFYKRRRQDLKELKASIRQAKAAYQSDAYFVYHEPQMIQYVSDEMKRSKKLLRRLRWIYFITWLSGFEGIFFWRYKHGQTKGNIQRKKRKTS